MAGAAAIEERFAQLQQRGVGIAIVDAISNEDLMRLGPALKTLPLLTAGSGVAIGLAQNHVILGSGQAGALPAAAGFKAIVSGSCSLATNRQVRHFIDSGLPSFAIDPHQLAQGANIVDKVLAWAKPRIAQSPLLIYSTANAQDLSHVHSQLGAQRAGEMVEQSLAAIARGLVALGVRQLVVAGGETSGACVQALNIQQMQIGTQIDPGVPWCHAHSDAAQGEGLHLTLKSGNFGTDDFFTKAFQVLV
jgi:3-dehydrotetronate 4-kinase